MNCRTLLLALAAWLAVGTGAALAEDAPTVVEVTIKDHRFAPAEIHIPAGKPAQLRISNADPTAEEFDSSSLHIEKVFTGSSHGIVRLHPLAPGRYPFMGEYHPDTAQGVVVAE